MKEVYSKKELYSEKCIKSYKGDAKEVAFLLGGIGTGNVSIGSRGELKDWEIVNLPSKGNYLANKFFAIWVKPNGEKPITKILESKMQPPYSDPMGFLSKAAGLPRFEDSMFSVKYPYVYVDFYDDQIPLDISMEAFNPFIPLNADDSGIPGFIIRYKIKNRLNKNVRITIAGSLPNIAGFNGFDFLKNVNLIGKVQNEYHEDNDIRGLFYKVSNISIKHRSYGNMSFITKDKNITYKTQWLESGWFDGIHDFWYEFSKYGNFKSKFKMIGAGGQYTPKYENKIGTLGINKVILPGEEEIFEFIITWYFPNRIMGWDGWDDMDKGYYDYSKENTKTIKNYYATKFKDSWNVCRYLALNINRLEKISKDFCDNLYNSTIPDYVIESIANSITVIRSNTCFRIEDGTFLSWEGCLNFKGMGPGSCTHLWNYAQTLAFLFPELEQTMRRIELDLDTDEAGRVSFRTYKVFGKKISKPTNFVWDMPLAADAQVGAVIKLYRDWKLSGNNELLEKLWDKAKKALDFALKTWDSDRDYVLDKGHHNIYDIEFYVINSFTNSMLLTALKAAIEISKFFNDSESVAEYENALKIATVWIRNFGMENIINKKLEILINISINMAMVVCLISYSARY